MTLRTIFVTRIFCLSAIALFCSLMAPPMVNAQLVGTQWTEQISLSTDSNEDNRTGTDSSLPEALNAQLTGAGYELNGDISFQSPGAPNVTTAVSASLGANSLTFMTGSSFGQVSFQFLVTLTSTPPVPVTVVPVVISATGTVAAEGDLEMTAYGDSKFEVWTVGDIFATWTAFTSNTSSGSDSFAEGVRLEFAPGFVGNCTMTASAGISAEILQSGISASATAYIDPVFSIADEIIPGSTANYRDHFEVQLSPGYWALGNPTPVEKTTWGRIKRFYQE